MYVIDKIFVLQSCWKWCAYIAHNWIHFTSFHNLLFMVKAIFNECSYYGSHNTHKYTFTYMHPHITWIIELYQFVCLISTLWLHVFFRIVVTLFIYSLRHFGAEICGYSHDMLIRMEFVVFFYCSHVKYSRTGATTRLEKKKYACTPAITLYLYCFHQPIIMSKGRKKCVNN